MKFPKITAILIFLLSLSVIALIFVIINDPKADEDVIEEQERTISEIVNRTAIVGFSPEVITVAAGGQYEADIFVETGGNLVTGVELKLEYDPEAITNVEIVAPTNLSVLFSETDSEAGIISYAVAVSPGSSLSGRESIGQLTFDVVSTENTLFPSVVSHLENTAVTAEGEVNSVLLEAKPLEIRILE